MSVASVKSALKTLIAGTTGVYNVYDRIRVFRTVEDVPVNGSIITWWEVYQTESIPQAWANSLVYYVYTFEVNGFYAINADTTSQSTFENLVEAVVNKILTSLQLGGVAEFGDWQVGEDIGLPHVKLGVTERPRCINTLHQCQITVAIRDATTKTLTL